MSSRTLILSILSESEAKAVKSVFGLDQYKTIIPIANSKYPSFYYPSDKSIIFSFIVNKGNEAAAIATTTLVDTFKPKEVILVGTCAGRPDQTKAGDVIISSLGVFDYGQSALASGQEIRFNGFNPSPTQSRAFSFLHSDKNLNAKWWPLVLSHALALNVADLGVINAKLFDKAIASGAQIINESSMKILTDANNSIYGSDQESSGFARACEEKNVEWIVVRGVSDCGERTERKNQAILATISAASIVKLYLNSNASPPMPEFDKIQNLKDEPQTDLVGKFRDSLGCSHVWIPAKGYESTENESRNQMKLSAISSSSGSIIRLVAQTGYSYLCNRGVFFNEIYCHLQQGGTFNILLPDLSTGKIILNKAEINSRNAKHHLATAGYSELKREFGDQIHLRTIRYDLPATLLITKQVCFFEPYIGSPAKREKLLFTSFEMLLDKSISKHGYDLMLDCFNHLFHKAEDLP